MRKEKVSTSKIGAEKSIVNNQQETDHQKLLETIDSCIETKTEKSSTLATLTYANVLSTGYSTKAPKASEPLKMNIGIGYTVATALKQAKAEDRLVIGLSHAVQSLSDEPEESMFCILAPRAGDSAAHMQAILLQAYCYENGIYTIKVDDPEKLSYLVNSDKCESCVLIQKYKQPDEPLPGLKLRINYEERLADHCEEYWDYQHKPVIRLPDE